MRVLIQEVRIDGGIQHVRSIAEWALPTTTEPLELAFTQLATPDTTKVCTYRIQIIPDPPVVLDRCPDCEAPPGEVHADGCDVARCLVTGSQRLMCEGDGHDCGNDLWSGQWPGFLPPRPPRRTHADH